MDDSVLGYDFTSKPFHQGGLQIDGYIRAG